MYLCIIWARCNQRVIKGAPAISAILTTPFHHIDQPQFFRCTSYQSVSKTAAVCPLNNGICSGSLPFSFSGITANAPPPPDSQLTDKYCGLTCDSDSIPAERQPERPSVMNKLSIRSSIHCLHANPRYISRLSTCLYQIRVPRILWYSKSIVALLLKSGSFPKNEMISYGSSFLLPLARDIPANIVFFLLSFQGLWVASEGIAEYSHTFFVGRPNTWPSSWASAKQISSKSLSTVSRTNLPW